MVRTASSGCGVDDVAATPLCALCFFFGEMVCQFLNTDIAPVQCQLKWWNTPSCLFLMMWGGGLGQTHTQKQCHTMPCHGTEVKTWIQPWWISMGANSMMFHCVPMGLQWQQRETYTASAWGRSSIALRGKQGPAKYVFSCTAVWPWRQNIQMKQLDLVWGSLH